MLLNCNTNISIEVRVLRNGKSYVLGRYEDCNFRFYAQQISRYQLEVEIAKVEKDRLGDASYITPVSVKVLTRARSTINGKTYKLAKGVKDPILLTYKTETRIVLELSSSVSSSSSDGSTETKDYPVVLEWKPFNISSSDSDKDDLEEAHRSGADFRISSPSVATHHYTTSDNLNAELAIALLRSIPVVDKSWIASVKDETSGTDWFLDLDWHRYLPNQSAFLLPTVRRLHLLDGVFGVSISYSKDISYDLISSMGGTSIPIKLKDYEFHGSFRGDKLLQDIKLEVKAKNEKVLFLVDGKSAPVITNELLKYKDSLVVTEEQLWESLKAISISNLHIINIGDLEPRESTTVQVEVSEDKKRTQTQPEARKRRKYEKVNKLHFFDFSAPPTQDSSDSHEVLPSTKDSKEQDEDEQKSTVTKETTPPITEHESSSNTDKEIAEEREPVEIPVQERKRHVGHEDSIERPKKLPKFTPKVSLIDAIKRTKEQASDSIKLELGIEDGLDEDSLPLNLSNLAIVETIEVKLRKVPVNSDELTSSFTEKYKGRKNFKAFKKNMKLKPQVTRTYVGMGSYTVNNEINFASENKTAEGVEMLQGERQLTKDFSGHMLDVKRIDEDSDENEEVGTETFSFASKRHKLRSQEPSLFVDEDSQPQEPTKPRAKSRSVATKTTLSHVHHDVDDDDDDNELPRFGFSRR